MRKLTSALIVNKSTPIPLDIHRRTFGSACHSTE